MHPTTKFFASEVARLDMETQAALEMQSTLKNVEPPDSDLVKQAQEKWFYLLHMLEVAMRFYLTALMEHERLPGPWSNDALIADAYVTARA